MIQLMHASFLLFMIAYGTALVLILRKLGTGMVITIMFGLLTVAVVWCALHITYSSDAPYRLMERIFPETAERLALESFAKVRGEGDAELGWFMRYLAALGWPLGICYFAVLWPISRWLRPNNSFKPNPLRGSA